MYKYQPLVLFLVLISNLSFANESCEILSGAKIIAQDDANTYLGTLTNIYDTDSIFNEYGTYGSEYNVLSVFNTYGEFGSEYSAFSATNPYSSTPPMLIKDQKIIGYLSSNKAIQGSVSASLVKALCADGF